MKSFVLNVWFHLAISLHSCSRVFMRNLGESLISIRFESTIHIDMSLCLCAIFQDQICETHNHNMRTSYFNISGCYYQKPISNDMSRGSKYHLQITNDLQTVLQPPVEDDDSTQQAMRLPFGRDSLRSNILVGGRTGEKSNVTPVHIRRVIQL